MGKAKIPSHYGRLLNNNADNVDSHKSGLCADKRLDELICAPLWNRCEYYRRVCGNERIL